MKKRWLLVVNDGRQADLMLHRLGLRPSTKRAGDYVGFYALGAKAQMLRHIEAIRAVGLHGLAKQIPAAAKRPVRSYPRRRSATAPSAEIISILAAQRARLEHDAQKRHQEARGLARAAAARQKREALKAADARARDALLRAKGEV